jgi:phenylalanine-4-hydroxylase
MSMPLQKEMNHAANVIFSDEDNEMWQKIYKKQVKRLENTAIPVFLNNLKKFNLSPDRIPNLNQISDQMFAATGWRTVPVDGLAGYIKYFNLLKEKLFPVAMFIRRNSEENLSKDPDIFHEIFGHCTMLLSQDYADFMQKYGEFALTVAEVDRPLFARLIWFTTETALIHADGALKIFGSSILSSYSEAFYALNSNKPLRKAFDVINIFREPYRADLLQKVYYVLDDPQQVYSLLDNTNKLYEALQIARKLGELPALFRTTSSKYANIGHCHPLARERVR